MYVYIGFPFCYNLKKCFGDYMPLSESRKKANDSYKKRKVKRIPLDVQKDYFDSVLKPAADAANEPVNTFIKKAIQQRIDREKE